MPKKKTKKKTGKKPSSKKKAPQKLRVRKDNMVSVSTLQVLEKELTFLKDTIRKPKNGDLKLSFFINSSREIVCFLYYGAEKIYYWGKIIDKTFIFDRSVPIKFLPNGKEKIDLSSLYE